MITNTQQLQLLLTIQIQHSKPMHQSKPQSVPYFDIFDPSSHTLATNSYFIENIKGNCMIIDKEAKSPIINSTKRNGRIVLPTLNAKMTGLGVPHRFLSIQVYLFTGMDWQICLQFSNSKQVKSHLMLSSKIKQEQKKSNTLKYPCPQDSKMEGWINLVLDLHSFMTVLRKQGEYEQQQQLSLNQICISGFFKLRRVFTMKELGNANTIKNTVQNQSQSNNFNVQQSIHSFPPTTKHQTLIIKYASHDCKSNNASLSTYPESGTEPSQHKMPRVLHPLKNAPINTQVPNTDRVGMSSKNKVKFNLGNKIRVSNDREPYRKNSDSTIKRKVLLSPIQQKLREISKSDLVADHANKENKNKWVRRRLVDAKNEKQTINGILTQRTSVTSNTNRNSHNLDSETENNLESIASKSNNYSRFSSMCDPSENSSGHRINLDQEQIMEELEYENSLLYNETGKVKDERVKLGNNTTLLQIPHLKPDQYGSSQDVIDCSANKITIADIQAETSKITATHEKFMNKKSYEGFGEDIIVRYMQEVQRPYSPPLGQQRPGDSILENEGSPKKNKHELELLYDPVLDCYYDCRAHTFYELKK